MAEARLRGEPGAPCSRAARRAGRPPLAPRRARADAARPLPAPRAPQVGGGAGTTMCIEDRFGFTKSMPVNATYILYACPPAKDA